MTGGVAGSVGYQTKKASIIPPAAGLRIGKKFNERSPDQPFDSRLEWDRDGQYFHYLTKWMHALHGVYRQTEDRRYLQWTVELGIAAYRAFVVEVVPGQPKRMFWKMSIDLTRPLVPSMGHHDPLDGLITLLTLQHAGEFPDDTSRRPGTGRQRHGGDV